MTTSLPFVFPGLRFVKDMLKCCVNHSMKVVFSFRTGYASRGIRSIRGAFFFGRSLTALKISEMMNGFSNSSFWCDDRKIFLQDGVRAAKSRVGSINFISPVDISVDLCDLYICNSNSSRYGTESTEVSNKFSKIFGEVGFFARFF